MTWTFDTVWFGDRENPMSERVFQTLLSAPPRVMLMPTTLRADETSKWNVHGMYSNALRDANTAWATIDPGDLAAWVRRDWDVGGFLAPWVAVNEISSAWRTSANEAYRELVCTFAEKLASYGLAPIIYSLIQQPQSEDDNWQRLANAGYIAVEGYLDAEKIVASSTPPNYWAAFERTCFEKYSKMREAYEARGVPLERLILVEHYGHTLAGAGRGRCGLPSDTWTDVILARAEGALAAGFQYLGSYAWMYNQMAAPESELVSAAQAYVTAASA